MAVDLNEFEHPAWVSVIATGVGYLLILALMTVVLFVVPWLLFVAL